MVVMKVHLMKTVDHKESAGETGEPSCTRNELGHLAGRYALGARVTIRL
jgi:hypothetical protein